jgi:hypothetical protein
VRPAIVSSSGGVRQTRGGYSSALRFNVSHTICWQGWLQSGTAKLGSTWKEFVPTGCQESVRTLLFGPGVSLGTFPGTNCTPLCFAAGLARRRTSKQEGKDCRCRLIKLTYRSRPARAGFCWSPTHPRPAVGCGAICLLIRGMLRLWPSLKQLTAEKLAVLVKGCVN